jgi:DNA-binding CsgD family transcriptional regulator
VAGPETNGSTGGNTLDEHAAALDPTWTGDSRARAIVDVTDPHQATVIAMNLPAELSAADLGITVGTTVHPLLVTDPETLAASTANFERLVTGEIEQYDTFSYFTDSTGTPITLKLTLRIGSGPDPGGQYLDITWHEVGMPAIAAVDPDEEVLDVAQLITTGVLADAPLGVALIDAARNVYVTVNHAYAAIIGLPRRELVNRGTEVGRPPDAPLVENAADVLGVVRGTVESFTVTRPIPGEGDIVRTATMHPIGTREQHARYLMLYLIERATSPTDGAPPPPLPAIGEPLPADAYARAVVDPDWRLRFVEPPLATWGLDRERLANRSVLPAIHPADIPSLLAASDSVRSGQTDRAVTRVHYRLAGPEPGYLSTEAVITREPGFPEGWLVFTNRLIGSGGKEVPIADRLRDITLSALNEDEGAVRGSLDTIELAHEIATEHGLTPRETEILALIVDGSRVTTIARVLHVTDGTVRNYLSAIFHKVGVRNQAELVEYAAGRRAAGA